MMSELIQFFVSTSPKYSDGSFMKQGERVAIIAQVHTKTEKYKPYFEEKDKYKIIYGTYLKHIITYPPLVKYQGCKRGVLHRYMIEIDDGKVVIVNGGYFFLLQEKEEIMPK